LGFELVVDVTIVIGGVFIGVTHTRTCAACVKGWLSGNPLAFRSRRCGLQRLLGQTACMSWSQLQLQLQYLFPTASRTDFPLTYFEGSRVSRDLITAQIRSTIDERKGDKIARRTNTFFHLLPTFLGLTSSESSTRNRRRSLTRQTIASSSRRAHVLLGTRRAKRSYHRFLTRHRIAKDGGKEAHGKRP